jgi:flavodoxin
MLLTILKVLIIGNSITYYNNFAERLMTQCQNQQQEIRLDTIFSPGLDIPILIGQYLYGKEEAIIGKNFILKPQYKYFDKKNNKYQDFVKLILSYDLIYLQSQYWNSQDFKDIVNEIFKINPKIKLFILQTFSTAIWDKEIFTKEISDAYQIFQKTFKKQINKRIYLLEFGNYLLDNFDNINEYLDEIIHPTSKGTDLIIHLFLQQLPKLEK